MIPRLPLTERFGHGEGDLRLRLDDLGLHLLDERPVLLLRRDRPSHAAPPPWPARSACPPRPGPSAARRPMFFPTSTSAMSMERISNAVPGVEPLGEHRLRDVVRVLEHRLVRGGRPDRGHDALADTGQDRLLPRPADEPVDVRPHRHARSGDELDPVLRHRGDLRRLDHARVDGNLHRVEHVPSREVDRGGLPKRQLDARLCPPKWSAFTTRSTSPPARKCDSSSFVLSGSPALYELMSG